MTLNDLNNLQLSESGSWPGLIKGIALLFIVSAVGAAGYWFDIKDLWADYEVTQRKEGQLKREFEEKQTVVANIEIYRERLKKLREMLKEVLKQLPTRTEMPNLLEDISNTGKANGLIFSLFKPGNEGPKEFYATVPISIRATASYHQFGAFISSIAALPRIVTVVSAKLTEPGGRSRRRGFITGPGDIRSEALAIEATLQTYRYLEEEE